MSTPSDESPPPEMATIVIVTEGQVALVSHGSLRQTVGAIGLAFLHAWPLRLGDGPFYVADGQMAVIFAMLAQELDSAT